MFARITTMQFKIDKIDDALKIYHESIVPTAQSQKGFKKIYLFLDRETGKGMSIALWKGKEDAIANEKSLYYQEQIIKLMPFFKANPIREGFEVETDV
ncbi:MAG: hypothetical protein JXB23_00730 [Candidatus Aminicenantes bacterium]|nr:hypothetical protein [Candidatus Aminicenantes bacterium]